MSKENSAHSKPVPLDCTLGAMPDYEGISEKLAEENIRIREAAERLWDGVTGVLEQETIYRIERLYKQELALLLGSP